MNIDITGNELGEIIRKRRKELGLTQAEFAHRLSEFNFDYAANTIGNWEAGRIAIPISSVSGGTILLHALGKALEISPAALLASAGWINTLDQEELSELPDIRELARTAAWLTEKQRKFLLDMATALHD